MNKSEAHQILDAARAGVEVSTAEITLALLATGDLSPVVRHSRPMVPSQVPPADPVVDCQPESRLERNLAILQGYYVLPGRAAHVAEAAQA